MQNVLQKSKSCFGGLIKKKKNVICAANAMF